MVQIVPSLAIGSFFRLAPVSLVCLHTPVEQKVNDGEKEEEVHQILKGMGSSNVVAVVSTLNRGLDSWSNRRNGSM